MSYVKITKRISLLLVLAVAVSGMCSCSCNDNKDPDYIVPSDYVIEYPDVEKYYQEHSEILSTSLVQKSSKVLSEKEALQILESRGFTDCPVTTEFSYEGDYIGQKEISDSSEKHPVYDTYYTNSSGDLWTISIIEDQILAIPVSYSLQSEDSVSVMVAEKEEIVSYDCSTNSYYRTIPNKEAMTLLCFDCIDARKLDSLTIEVLSNG